MTSKTRYIANTRVDRAKRRIVTDTLRDIDRLINAKNITEKQVEDFKIVKALILKRNRELLREYQPFNFIIANNETAEIFFEKDNFSIPFEKYSGQIFFIDKNGKIAKSQILSAGHKSFSVIKGNTTLLYSQYRDKWAFDKKVLKNAKK